MKKILLIGTGGTIASVPTEKGLMPGISSAELIKYVPAIADMCTVDCIQLMNLDSTNVTPAHWLEMASAVRESYDRYDGFVITHGTDTMAYSAAALSYLIQNSTKPVVFTGAQKAVTETGSDAVINLADAFTCACDDSSAGILLVFSGAVILGTRARKNFAKSFMAFGSINYPEVARIQDGHMTWYIRPDVTGEPVFYDSIDDRVGLIKLVPGLRDDVMSYIIDSCDGLVIESFGVGGLPEYSNFYEQIKRAEQSGKIIIMTTQVPNEGSDLSVYHVGKVLKEQFRVLEAHDMTTEAAFTKLMWILGITSDFEKAEELFYTNVYNDILFY